MLKRPCYRCGRPTRQNPCADCINAQPAKPRQTRRNRPSRQARGYDAAYEQARTHMIEQVRIYGGVCVFCGVGFEPGETITAEHTSPTTIAPAHSRCNSSDGGRRSRSGPRRLQAAR